MVGWLTQADADKTVEWKVGRALAEVEVIALQEEVNHPGTLESQHAMQGPRQQHAGLDY